jgi:hypothetical protein
MSSKRRSACSTLSEIRGHAFDLPVAVADGVGPIATREFLGHVPAGTVALGAADRGLGQRTLRGGRQAALPCILLGLIGSRHPQKLMPALDRGNAVPVPGNQTLDPRRRSCNAMA